MTNPFFVSLALVMTFIITVSVWLILPCFNLHFINSNSAIFKTRVQQVLDLNRNSPEQAITEINALRLAGINLKDVQYDEENDFYRFHLDYGFTGLFANKFFSEDYKSKMVSLDFLIDKV